MSGPDPAPETPDPPPDDTGEVGADDRATGAGEGDRDAASTEPPTEWFPV